MTKDKIEIYKHSKVSGIEFIYTLFLALLIALFIGLGISAFYPAPKAPEYPIILTTNAKSESAMTQEQTNAQMIYEINNNKYREDTLIYNRNVSMITLGLAVVTMVISLMFMGNIHVLSNGLLLGGVFTLIYSISRGLATEDDKYRFIVVSIGLIVTLVIGYVKFIKPIDFRKKRWLFK